MASILPVLGWHLPWGAPPLDPIQFTRRKTPAMTHIRTLCDAQLADDLFVEYSRIINPNTFLTAGAIVSLPG